METCNAIEVKPLDVLARRGERIVVKANTVRAITYGPSGQRCEQWLPAGLYQVDGQCSLAPARMANTEWIPALILFRALPQKPDGVWYVHPSAV